MGDLFFLSYSNTKAIFRSIQAEIPDRVCWHLMMCVTCLRVHTEDKMMKEMDLNWISSE